MSSYLVCSLMVRVYDLSDFLFNDTAITQIYTLSLHDALPIYAETRPLQRDGHAKAEHADLVRVLDPRKLAADLRSEEHTSELQSRQYLVCRLLLEKKKTPS